MEVVEVVRKQVGDREGVRRGVGGPEEVQKAREVIVRYKFPHTMSSLCEFFCI